MSLTQSPTEEVPKTTINSDTVPMDHPDQAQHTPDNGKPVHALVNLDIAISAHAGSRSAVAVEHELSMSAEEVGSQIDLSINGGAPVCATFGRGQS